MFITKRVERLKIITDPFIVGLDENTVIEDATHLIGGVQ
jgi:hypothetical protein